MKKCSYCGEVKGVGKFRKRIDSKDGLRNECKACKAVKDREYRQRNKERLFIKKKECLQKNKRKIANRKRAYRQENKEKIAVYQKNYQQDNKEKIAAFQREYREKNKKQLATKKKEYYQTPAGKKSSRIGGHKRRIQKIDTKYQSFNPIEIFERDGWRCQHCRKKVRPDYKNPNHPLYPNLDHIICLSHGGKHTKRNTQLLCHRCNLLKHSNDSGEQLRLFG